MLRAHLPRVAGSEGKNRSSPGAVSETPSQRLRVGVDLPHHAESRRPAPPALSESRHVETGRQPTRLGEFDRMPADSERADLLRGEPTPGEVQHFERRTTCNGKGEAY